MPALLQQLWKDDSAQGLTEYALVVGAVATLIIALAAVFREELGIALKAIGQHITSKAQELT